MSDLSFCYWYYIGKPVKPSGSDPLASATNLKRLHRKKEGECNSPKITTCSQV